MSKGSFVGGTELAQEAEALGVRTDQIVAAHQPEGTDFILVYYTPHMKEDFDLSDPEQSRLLAAKLVPDAENILRPFGEPVELEGGLASVIPPELWAEMMEGGDDGATD